MPNRRKVLIGLGGSIAIAGCSGEESEPEQEEEEPRPEPEPEPEHEEEAEPEPEEEAVEGEPNPEPEEDDDDEPSILWNEHMEAAEDLLHEGIELYASFGGENSSKLVDVLFSTTEFDWTESHSTLNNAREEAAKARSIADRNSEERKLAENLREEAIWLDDFARFQSNHIDLFEIFADIIEGILNEEIGEGDIDSPLDTLISLEESFEEKQDWYNDFEPVANDSEVYEAKFEQIEAELDTADSVVTGINYILNPGFGTQQERASLAKREFEDALDVIENEGAYPPEGTLDQDYIDVVTVWEVLAEELERELRTI